MKRVILIALIFITTIATAQMKSSKLNWHTNLEEAQTLSQVDNKPILIYFTGSDWCAPCKKLKEDFFESPKFKHKAEDLVLVVIDYPRRVDLLSQEQLDYNKTVIAKYNKQQTFPKLVMLNSEGREMGRISGYSPSRDTSKHFTFIDEHIQVE
ncbi:thioredoxin family protein [Marixanthomonas ophiurae]|uniref:Thioredoxin family protein n=1 Tax=Marixanthomonas ophiurae TaxID=387659 RepID=A0A3E1Q8C4_9FLAO|nr:thioredoxin family protein [Marixanthomonas ophiurae]RFN58372.1 thioredoxin family protein [Marixanthomonas ophiurae]